MNGPHHRPDATRARTRREATRIGEWVLYADLGLLRRDQTEVRLNAKTLHVLLVLLDAGDRGVSRDALMDDVWGASYPSDNVVSRAIADLRSAFGEKAGEQRYIRTLPKYGYQLLAEHGPVDDGSISLPQPGMSWSRITALLVAGAAMLTLVVFYRWWPPLLQEDQETGVRYPLERPLTAAPGIEHQPRLSADGNWVVYAALRPGRSDWDLYRVSTTDGVSQAVAVTPDVHEHGPALSPSGDEVAYIRLSVKGCDVVIQSTTLGVPETIARCTSQFPTLVDWSRDGNWLAYTVAESDDADRRRRIYAVHRFNGVKKRLTDAISATGTDFYPRFSPSGKSLAFLRGEPQPDHRSTLWLVDTESGAERRLVEQATQIGGMTWLDESTLAYSLAESGHMQGYWLNVDSGVNLPVEQIDLVHADFLPEKGMLVATKISSDRDLLLWQDDGSTRIVARSTNEDHHGQLSPDEAWVALISRRSGFDELWLAATDEDTVRQLTRFDGATVRYPDWHPDGRKILFTVQTDAGERLYQVDIVGGSVRPAGPDNIEATTPRWMPDGIRWVFGCRRNGEWGICLGSDTGIVPIAGAFFRPQPIDNDSLAAIDSAGVLYRLDIDTGKSTVIWRGLPAAGRFGWVISGEYLIYVYGTEENDLGQVLRRKLRSGEETLLYRGAMPLADVALSVGRQSGSILFVTYQSSSDDLVLFRGVKVRPQR